MPRAALISFLLAICALSAAAKDPHLDPTLVTTGCRSCHAGHGTSGSPMLDRPQKDVCLGCHDSQASVDRKKVSGELTAKARPPLVGADLALPFSHPLSDKAFSKHENGIVACTSCHSPHRASGGRNTPVGQPRPSPTDPRGLEYDLCDTCHGSLATVVTVSPGRKVDPRNASYHPVRAIASNRSPSVRPELSGRQINCSECHGGRAGQSATGVHGSSVRGLLVKNYVTIDGAADPATGYDLCWSCHDAKVVFDATRSPFPLHKLHVVNERASCATCHDPHGSVANRSLVPFGTGGVPTSGVSPSIKTGSLSFTSAAPGSGTCSLTCHGHDHAPASYGRLKAIATLSGERRPPFAAPIAPVGRSGDPGPRIPSRDGRSRVPERP